MTAALFILHWFALLALSIVFTGLINRTKALWAGRRGPPLLQTLYDLHRLLRKTPVVSSTTTPVFRWGPLVLLASALASAAFVPVLRDYAPISLPFDFIAVTYLWGLGRVALMLAALDTGSAFEGMGASREATLGALVEPALLVGLGTLSAASGQLSLASLLHGGFTSPERAAAVGLCAFAFFIVLLVEAARIPVDDPNTHLELTMIHEVMILDHSGPELAALQYASALKMTLCAALVAGLLNPVSRAHGPLAVAAVNLLLMAAVFVLVGSLESLVARFKVAVVPRFISAALIATVIALLAVSWANGGAR